MAEKAFEGRNLVLQLLDAGLRLHLLVFQLFHKLLHLGLGCGIFCKDSIVGQTLGLVFILLKLGVEQIKLVGELQLLVVEL